MTPTHSIGSNEPRPGGHAELGAVVIGRNEGERLQRCINSMIGRVAWVVYVDSGSTDGSVATARALGADVVSLDLQQPFTAARARNQGASHLLSAHPSTEFIQFVDGDCSVDPDWLNAAAVVLTSNPQVGVVCGRRREARPEASIYNRLCDLEWDTPIGDAKACGGDSLMRAEAFSSVGGFNPWVIAGEEPELCVRLRVKGWRILRIDHEMTRHDAAMTSFRQWWMRTLRAGHAYAEGAAMHGSPPERHCVRDVRSILLWGALLPAVALMAAWTTRGLSVAVLLLVYLLQAGRIAAKEVRRGRSRADSRLYGAFMVVAKFPLMLGVVKYWVNRLRGTRSKIIEYKSPEAAPLVAGGKASP